MRLLLIAAVSLSVSAQPLPVSSPEKEGLSSERLERVHQYFAKLTSSGQRPGAIDMIVRNGHIVDWRAYGLRNVEKNLPMEKDTICAIYSMTKPVTTVAVMMLVEEGKIVLNDPLEKYLPEFKDLKVHATGAPAKPMTVRQLLSHTSGLSYGIGTGPVADLYNKNEIFKVDNLKGFVDKLTKLPLASQPGEKWEYSVGLDVAGYLVQVVSGQPFDEFVSQRITRPLKMVDTSFGVPEEKRNRMSRIYGLRNGKLTDITPPMQEKVIPFGGMSLFSTIGDYSRFAQMLLNHGELEGVRLLGRKTVDLMMMNHLTGMTSESINAVGADGFGLGGSVRVNPARSGRPGSKGLFGWSGAATTYFRVDPSEKMAILAFMQWMWVDSPALDLFETLAYQSVVN